MNNYYNTVEFQAIQFLNNDDMEEIENHPSIIPSIMCFAEVSDNPEYDEDGKRIANEISSFNIRHKDSPDEIESWQEVRKGHYVIFIEDDFYKVLNPAVFERNFRKKD